MAERLGTGCAGRTPRAALPRAAGHNHFVIRAMIWAFVLCGVAAVLWVCLLHGLPLGRAHTSIGLVFAIATLLGWLVFHTGVDGRYCAGRGLLRVGLHLISSGR